MLRRLSSTLRRDWRCLIPTALFDQEDIITHPALWTAKRGVKRSFNKKLLECFRKEISFERENYETEDIVTRGPPNGFTLLEMEGNLIVLHKKQEKEDITIRASFTEQPLPEKENPEDPESAWKDRQRRLTVTNRYRPLFDHPSLGRKKEKLYAIVRDPMKADVKFILPKWMVIGPEGKHHHTFGWTINQEPPKDPFFDPPILEVSQTIVLTVILKKEGMDKHLLLECETDGGYMSINHVGLEPKELPLDGTYTGPAFGDLDETLQDTFNNWAEERGIDDVIGDYLIQKIHDVEQKHYQKWLDETQQFLSKD